MQQGEAGVGRPPAEGLDRPARERPEHRGGETCDQGQMGDRFTGVDPVELRQGGEGGAVEHQDADHLQQAEQKSVGDQVGRQRQRAEAQARQKAAQRHQLRRAPAIHQPPQIGRGESADQQPGRENGVERRRLDLERGRDSGRHDRERVIERAVADDLGQAQGGDDPDQVGSPLVRGGHDAKLARCGVAFNDISGFIEMLPVELILLPSKAKQTGGSPGFP